MCIILDMYYSTLTTDVIKMCVSIHGQTRYYFEDTESSTSTNATDLQRIGKLDEKSKLL